MSQDRGSSNPLKGLFDRVREVASPGGRGSSNVKPKTSGGMRNEAEQREADAEFERRKEEMEERRDAANEYRSKLELRAERNLRAERAERAGSPG